MSKRIKIILVGIAEFATILAMLSASIIFYQGFEAQVYEDLRVMAYLFAELDYTEITEEGENDFMKNKLRISVISKEGSVIYDNQMPIEEMNNHKNREEIREAKEKGEGKAARKSETLGSRTYYYAIQMKDGDIVRVAKKTSTFGMVFYQYCPFLIIILLGLVFICLILGHYFTKKLVEPIEHLANHLEEEQKGIYPELIPFVTRIKAQHEDIIKSARMRQDFTANVSHELKTPLTSISGYSELIESGMVSSEDTQRFAKEIHKNSSRLLTLINDIIRLSELDATEDNCTLEKVNLYEVTRSCVEMLQLNAKKHNVTLTFWGEHCEVMASKEMIEELVYNLCDNAIRYNKIDGDVHVAVKNMVDHVLLSVSDTGIGISENQKERIFERFYRVDKSRSKSTGGTGLGLAIVKHIVSQVHANIKLESELGKGTKIEVTFLL